MSLQEWVGATSAAFAGAGAFAAFLAARATRVAAEEGFREGRQAQTLTYVQAQRERYRELRHAVGALDADLPSIESDKGRQLLNLLELWEHQAAGLNDGAFDLEVFNKMTGGYVLTTYRMYAAFVRRVRREDPAIYDQLEVLVDKLIVMRSAGYVIDRRALRRLRRDGMDRYEMRMLRGLRRPNEYPFPELQRRLIETGVDHEKNRITRICRQVLGHVEHYDSSCSADVADLFVAIQRATVGQYPPRELLEHYYPPGREGIQAWLQRGRCENRFVFRLDDHGPVIGHVEVEPLNVDLSDEQVAYWSGALAQLRPFQLQGLTLDRVAVIKRLGVAPQFQGRDVGRQLLRFAIHQIEFTHRLVPALVVLEGLHAAQRLYESEGASQVGIFREATGEAMRSYVF